MATFTGADDLAGAEFVGVDLHGARFRDPVLRGARIRGALLNGAEIDGDIDGLRINGVEVAPLVEAELDRRHPERSALRARDAAARRDGWAAIEAMWAPTMERAAALPPSAGGGAGGGTGGGAGGVEVSVDGEWSFAQTLRHLVFATDVWLGDAILGRAAEAYHPIGVPFSGWRKQAAAVLDLDAAPTYEEVVQVRSERVAMVRDFLARLTDDQLREQRDGPRFVGGARFPVGQCLWIVFNEEWHHHRYAVRDLDALGG
jgi:DinB family protein/pentapeptide repeat protein